MAEKITVPYDALLKNTLRALGKDGLLLVSQGADGSPNAMAIGWGTIGSVWSRPMFVVLVRPSRYTHELLEANGDFTVNVLPKTMGDVVTYCGTVSGRDHDKFAEKNLTAVAGLECETPIVGESLIAYECRTVMTTDVLPDRIDGAIRSSAYPAGDFHRVYFGKILCVRAEPDMLPAAGEE